MPKNSGFRDFLGKVKINQDIPPGIPSASELGAPLDPQHRRKAHHAQRKQIYQQGHTSACPLGKATSKLSTRKNNSSPLPGFP
jgi:hypothetical protein